MIAGHRSLSPVLPFRPSFFASGRIPMEVNLIRRTLDDLAERSEALRRFL